MFAFEVAGTGYRFFFANLKTFFMTALPFVAVLVTTTTNPATSGEFGGLSDLALLVLAHAGFAFFWHRLFLMGKHGKIWWQGETLGSTKLDLKAFSKLFLKFLLWSLGIFAAYMFLTVIVIALGVLVFGPDAHGFNLRVSYVSLFITSPFLFRFLPFLPALAIGEQSASIGQTLTFTRGYTFQIWLALILTTVPVHAFNYLVCVAMLSLSSDYLVSSSALPVEIGIDIVSATLSIALVAIGVGANSEIFRRLSGWEPPVAEESGP